MNALKAAIIPGTLAFVGSQAARMFAPASTPWQIGGGVAGAILGVFLAAKI